MIIKSNDPYINAITISIITGWAVSYSENKICEIQNELEAQGYKRIKGKIPLSEFRKKYKIDKKSAIDVHYAVEEEAQKKELAPTSTNT